MRPEPRTVAEAYLLALRSRGVEFVFANAGTDFAPVIEAIAALQRKDRSAIPEPIAVLHEAVAVAMAHGYHLVTGRPQCTMVHVNVGSANALTGLINAARADVPLLFVAGRTPVTERGRPGSRDLPIHWGQEMFDQATMAREFVKWDYELRAGEQVVDLVDRALAIAQAEPCGPVHLIMPREVLGGSLSDDFGFSSEPAFAVPSPPFPDPNAVDEAVSILAGSRRPLIISSKGDQQVFDSLTRLASRHSIPVAHFWNVNQTIATSHPMYAGDDPRPLLADADAILVVDTMVPWLPGQSSSADGAKVIQIGPDPLFSPIPVRLFRADVSLTSSTAPALDAISDGLEEAGYATLPDTVDRRSGLVRSLTARRARAIASSELHDGGPITHPHMSRVISEVTGPDAVIVNELGVIPEVMDFSRQDSYFASPLSSGLGWGGGAALGIKLAAPERLVVWTTGDGSYAFANPTSCHHAASSLNLGLLTIVTDNRVWNAVRRTSIAQYPEGAAARALAEIGDVPLSSLEPAPDYAGIVTAHGGHGERVEEAADLRPALERAIAAAHSGQQALVSVRTAP